MSRSNRYTVFRPPPGLLAPTLFRPRRGDLDSRLDPVPQERRLGVPGELAVLWERQDVILIMWLSGALDQATVTLLDRELDGRALGTMRLVVDLTGLELIDSTGYDALVGIHWRASERRDQLSFRHGTHVFERPFELSPTVDSKRPGQAPRRATGASDALSLL